MSFDPQALCGWKPDFEKITAFEMRPENRRACADSQALTAQGVDTFLWLALREVHPRWKRGAQGIGDCVSWGAELAMTMLLAIQHKAGTSTWEAEAATEPIYGGGRVEANGGRLGGWSDGSWGSAAAEWLGKWGVLLRKDYSKETGNPEHNLTKYSSDKAKQWGNYGCGGKQDDRGSGKLDMVAREYPVKAVAKIESVDQAAGLVENWYPITIASNVGFGDMDRDSTGVVRRRGSWGHQMMLGGVRYVSGKPQFRCFQSWGDSCSGPDPGIDWSPVSACSWWITAEDASTIFKQGDSWAFSDIAGFAPRKFDFEHGKITA